MADILFRKAKMEDCYSIAELKGIVWNTTYKGIYSDEALSGYDITKNQLIFEEIVANSEIELYVATDEDKIVGFMTCGKPYRAFQDFEQEVGLLYILKEYQHQGSGSGFFDIARKQVKANGHYKLCVGVKKQKLSAIKFYEAMGGKQVCTDDRQIKFEFKVE